MPLLLQLLALYHRLHPGVGGAKEEKEEPKEEAEEETHHPEWVVPSSSITTSSSWPWSGTEVSISLSFVNMCTYIFLLQIPEDKHLLQKCNYLAMFSQDFIYINIYCITFNHFTL